MFYCNNSNQEEGVIIMQGIIIMHTFKLKEGASIEDFKLAAEDVRLNVKKRYAYQLLKDGDGWADMCIFETEEAFQNFVKNINEVANNPYIKKFQSYLDGSSVSRRRFTVEESY